MRQIDTTVLEQRCRLRVAARLVVDGVLRLVVLVGRTGDDERRVGDDLKGIGSGLRVEG